MKRIGDLLTRHKTPVTIQDDVIYKQVTIRTHYKGVVLRGTKIGSEIGTKNQWRVSAGQFILSRIDARNGAFGIIPKELEGAIVTNDFLAFDLNEDEVEREFFNVFLQSPVFLDACIKASRGNTNRKRIEEDFFLAFELNLPPLSQQRHLITKINKARSSLAIANREITHQATLLDKLKRAILQEAIQGKLTVDWRAANPDVEPASQLLEGIIEKRIADYELALSKTKKLGQKKQKKPRGLLPCKEYSVPDWSDIPTTWEPTVIDMVGLVCIGGTPDRNRLEYWNGSIPWVSSGEVANCLIGDTKEKITDLGFQNASVTMHPPGTILVAMIGQGKTRGQSAILKIDACTNQNSASIVIDHGLIVPEFLWLVFLARYEESREAAKGGNQPALNGQIIGAIPFRLPPLAEQAVIVERVEALMTTCQALEAEIERSRSHAAHLLQAVLKEAFMPS